MRRAQPEGKPVAPWRAGKPRTVDSARKGEAMNTSSKASQIALPNPRTLIDQEDFQEALDALNAIGCRIREQTGGTPPSLDGLDVIQRVEALHAWAAGEIKRAAASGQPLQGLGDLDPVGIAPGSGSGAVPASSGQTLTGRAIAAVSKRRREEAERVVAETTELLEASPGPTESARRHYLGLRERALLVLSKN